jgi:hypothetical protein
MTDTHTFDAYKDMLQETFLETDEPVCQITGLLLTKGFVTLECKHVFNYMTLLKEICKQKYEFKTYKTWILNSQNNLKVLQSKLDYFIKCPYCRNVQFEVLPYYPELGIEKIYGVNSLEPNLLTCVVEKINERTTAADASVSPFYSYYGADDFTFNHKKWGIKFQKGNCFQNTSCNPCHSKYVTYDTNSGHSYCCQHYLENMGCQAILKSGQKKGTKCCSLKTIKNKLCKRHLQLKS